MTEPKPKRVTISGPSDDELARINSLLRRIGGPNVSWGAVHRLEVWVAETRLESERLASNRLLIATWVLAFATVALVVATVGLIVAG